MIIFPFLTNKYIRTTNIKGLFSSLFFAELMATGKCFLKGRCLLLLLRIRSAHLEIHGFPIGDAY